MAAILRGDLRPQADVQAVAQELSRLPLAFELNTGQVVESVRFLTRSRHHALFLTPRESVLVLQEPMPGSRPLAESRPDAARHAVLEAPERSLRMKLIAANPKPKLVGLDELPGRSHYLLGSDPRRWRRDVARYASVKYEGVYPGIDLVYHGREGVLEHDWIVAPGADPGRIRVGFEGTGPLSLDDEGNLVLSLGAAPILQRAPVVFQESHGSRRMLRGRYRMAGPRAVGFQVEDYDPSLPLVIDPSLDFSSYLGGSVEDAGQAIAVDAAGAVYVAGYTLSLDFPTASPLQTRRAGPRDAFVTKLAPSGDAVEYSTYLGGAGSDVAYGIAVDGSGSVTVAGSTASRDFPVAGALQGASGGGTDAFVARLDPSGASLVYSTYLGGIGIDEARAVALDASGSAYVAGRTLSRNFPTASPLQSAPGGAGDAFVAKLSAAGDALVYSTFLGGKAVDEAHGIAVDGSGQAYVIGRTRSTDFPTFHALQPGLATDPRASAGFDDAFVAKLTAAGDAFVYSTYLGGVRDEDGVGIAADSGGNAYAVGTTRSPDFPVVNPLQQILGGGFDAFLAKIAPDGAALVYSTYLGGRSPDAAAAVAVDAAGHAYVGGWTYSSGFPLVRPLGPYAGVSDAFVSKLIPSGDALVYSTPLGGKRFDTLRGLAVDGAGSAYVSGLTQSVDFPTGAALQSRCHGAVCADAFVAKLTDDGADPAPMVRPSGGRIEEDDPAVGLGGTWYPRAGGGHSSGHAAFALARKARAVVTFEGTAVSWIGLREPAGGNAIVYIDNVPVKTVDTYASPAEYQAELFAVAGLTQGVHTLAVEATGTRNPRATQARVWVDAFDVNPAPSPTPPPQGDRIEQTDTGAVAYRGTWFTNTQSGHSGGSAALSAEAGAQVSVTFSGTGIQWIGFRDEWSGLASVFVDGVWLRRVDTYATPAQYQAVVTTVDGLQPGTHTLTIEALGIHGAAAADAWVWVDAFDVTNNPPPPPPVQQTPTRFEQDDRAVSYTGNWYPSTYNVHSGGSAVFSEDRDGAAVATMRFTGSGIRWIGFRDPWSGIGNVLLDGQLVSIVDSYADPEQPQAVLFAAGGLAPGAHTLALIPLHKRNPASGAKWVWVDAFDVFP
jgi:hypothetical protein